jgi:hypothetical protein
LDSLPESGSRTFRRLRRARKATHPFNQIPQLIEAGPVEDVVIAHRSASPSIDGTLDPAVDGTLDPAHDACEGIGWLSER